MEVIDLVLVVAARGRLGAAAGVWREDVGQGLTFSLRDEDGCRDDGHEDEGTVQ